METEASAVVVAAGPGTGKTRTLTARIAFLVEKRGVSPAFITAVTFTNQAAAEMRARLEKQLGAGQLRGLKIGTFHSLCLALLTDPLAVADEFDCQKIAEKTVKTLSLEISSRRLLEEISKRKNGLANGFDAGKIPEEAYSAYCLTLEQLHAMDYDDILLHALTKLEQAPPPCRYLLVDEFQDLNGLQYRLIRAMAGKEGQIFAIGDPDQSIYGFRGSHASYFDRFLQEHPGAQKICLRQNYRSTPLVRPFLQTDPQEERRLLYVGMTRAREELVLLSPGELSPFIKELPQGLYKFGKAKALSETGGRQLSFFS